MRPATTAVPLLLTTAGPATGQSGNAPPGPADDGTLPALHRIVGTGTTDSRALAHLTELGWRSVPATPAARIT